MRDKSLNLNACRKKLFKGFLLLTGLLLSGCFTSQKLEKNEEIKESVSEISIIPEPSSVKRREGWFNFTPEIKIVAADETAFKAAAALNNILMEEYGFKLQVSDDANSKNHIIFSTAVIGEDQLSGEEGYLLKITPKKIQIEGSERGMFYAVQSLIQIFPLNFTGSVRLPVVEISDAPRFRYRGMHLDVSRHFMPVEFVKKTIRLLSKYKYNYFHWHLTDDQGWRIEIKKYPRLTEIGSKRRETVVGKSYRPYIGDNIPVEGFYTQDEIRDVVEYAKARYVTIVPEIEMPGHSSSALAAYPELGCRKNYHYQVQTTWGAFPENLCPSEQTFQFIEDVLSEVINLFPNSLYIHIGGDEVLTNHWKESQTVQDLKKTMRFSDEKDVQNWFIRRVESFVYSKGKKIIGWDDILDDRLPSNAVVMSWHGGGTGLKAANAEHEVIMTPADFTYFDHPQGDPKFEPLSLGKTVSLEKVYKFDPVPAELKPENVRYIIGAQGCVWTEFLKNTREVEYMMFPRAVALAEVLWSRRKNKDFKEFSKRLYREFPNLDRENVNYRIPEPYGLDYRKIFPQEKVLVDLSPSIPSGKIYYTLDGTIPNQRSNLYTAPFFIDLKPKTAISLKARVIDSNGRLSSVFAANYLRGAGIVNQMSENYGMGAEKRR